MIKVLSFKQGNSLLSTQPHFSNTLSTILYPSNTIFDRFDLQSSHDIDTSIYSYPLEPNPLIVFMRNLEPQDLPHNPIPNHDLPHIYILTASHFKRNSHYHFDNSNPPSTSHLLMCKAPIHMHTNTTFKPIFITICAFLIKHL